MTGVHRHQGNHMSDDNNSGGIFGAIISAFVLVAIWPYLMALLGIYIAYVVALAILAWIAENWILVAGFACGILAIYCTFRYKLISKAWRYLYAKAQPKPIRVELNDLSERSRVPSTNLYCYWCTRKLGIQAWEKNGKYVCQECHDKGLL